MVELDHEAGQALIHPQFSNVINLDKAWKKGLSLNQYGNIKKSFKNIKLIFENDEALKNIGRTNEFSSLKEIYNRPPWRKTDDSNTYWTDADDSQLRNYFALRYELERCSSLIDDYMEEMFYKNSYHPIRNYLKELSWDREKRVETIFIDFLGADDSLYSRTVTKKMLVAAVARVFEPGVKFDNALILFGKQGAGKSYVLSRLGGEWFNESITSFKGDEALKKLRESWIVELAELSALKASEVEEAKGFITARVDTYRPSYARNIGRFPRQCVFFGSTNSFEFLKDKTGNRRFWPLPIDSKKRKMDPFKELTNEYVNQVWAEAYHLYKKGEKLFLENEEVNKIAKKMQEEHTSDDGMVGVIQEYLDRNSKVAICAREIWFECLHNDKEPPRHKVSDINEILRSLDGWTPSRGRYGKYGHQRGFRRML